MAAPGQTWLWRSVVLQQQGRHHGALRRREGMAIQTQVQVIDADAHVVETERTWDYLEPSEQKYRPTPIRLP